MTDKHILITGAAGYIGSLLTSELLRRNYRVTVLDNLLFGGESLLGFFHHPNFHFVKADVSQPRAVKEALKDGWQKPNALVHLAAIVGFPACQAIGKQAARRYNVEATEMVFEQAVELGMQRFVFASTCNVYGESSDGKPVTETSALNPHSLYAETKVEAEERLLAQQNAACAPLIFRLATLYGVSPRTRFDLIVNQFVLDAFMNHKLWVYRKGNLRSFIHVQDTVEGLIKGLEAPESAIRGEIYNLGTQNYKKYNDDPEVDNLEMIKDKKIDNLADLVKRYVSEKAEIEYKDFTFGGDMSDISLSFEKIERALDFKGKFDVVDGVRELKFALKNGLIHRPFDGRYRNARPFIEQ
jgi:nucleoside-diphosphate-sugar epimerase